MSASIAARAHSNATLSAPAVRRARPAQRRASRFAGFWRAVLRRPGRSLVLFLFATVALTILLNAVVFQKVRHPAPMAAVPAPVSPPSRPAALRAEPARAEAPPPVMEQAAASAATPATATAPVPPALLPPSRPGTLSQAAREAPRPPAPVVAAQRPAAAAPSAPAQHGAARSQPSRDPIADLINGELRPPAEIRGVAAARPASPRRTAEN